MIINQKLKNFSYSIFDLSLYNLLQQLFDADLFTFTTDKTSKVTFYLFILIKARVFIKPFNYKNNNIKNEYSLDKN